MKKQAQKNRFWFYQLSGWGLFVVYNLVIRGSFTVFNFAELVNSVTTGVAIMIATALLRYPLVRIAQSDNLLLLALKVIPLTILATILTQAIYAAVVIPNQVYIFGREVKDLWVHLAYGMSSIWFMVLVWTGIFLVAIKQNKLQHIEKDKIEIALSLKSAELDLLTSQINPHFIFNAINNIRALILEDGDKSRDMLASLSEVMRYTMLRSDQLIRFEDELFIAEQYLALNQLHFEERLKINWHIEQQTLPFKLPRMLLQLLVENAIKHGIGKLREGGVISITTENHQTYWKIVVSNSGIYDKDKKSDTGIGLPNIKQRLMLIYDDKAEFLINQKEDLVVAEILIPLSINEINGSLSAGGIKQ